MYDAWYLTTKLDDPIKGALPSPQSIVADMRTYPKKIHRITAAVRSHSQLVYFVAAHSLLPRSPLLAARTPTRTLRLAGRILNAMNCRNDGDEGTGNDTTNGADARGTVDSISASRTRGAIDELVDHNDERSPEQKQQYMLMAAFVARLCVAGSGSGSGGDGGRGGKKSKGKSGSALSWPSAGGRGFPGLVDAVFAVLGKVSCNVSSGNNHP